LSTDKDIERRLKDSDPLRHVEESSSSNSRRDTWNFLSRTITSFERRRRTRKKLLVGGIVSTVIAIGLSSVLVTGTQSDVAASILETSAHRGLLGDRLPTLRPGQFWYQDSLVTTICSFSIGEEKGTLKYVSKAHLVSWINMNGAGKIQLRSNSANGIPIGHFFTPLDRQRWIAAGRPLNPCAVSSAVKVHTSSSHLISGSVVVNTDLGLGTSFRVQSGTLRVSRRIESLPRGLKGIERALKLGEVSPSGFLSSVPRLCPIFGRPGIVGCSKAQEVEILMRLMSAPTTSIVLEPVLLDELAKSGSPSVYKTVRVRNSNNEVQFIARLFSGTRLDLTVNTKFGHLISAAIFAGSSIAPTSKINFGPIRVVNKAGARANA